MKIEQSSNVLTLTSTTVSGHKYVHALQKVTTLTTTYYSGTFTENVSTISLSTDGYYIVSEIRLPDAVSANNYYILNNKIYNNLGVEISIEELLAVDPTGTNIIRTDYDQVSYHFINDYMINLIKQTFLKGICGCSCSTRDNKQTIDTIIMGIEVLKNLIEFNLYLEAERIIENLGICTGILNANCNCNA